MRGWLRQHWQAFRGAARKIAGQRMASLLNAVVIGIALALPVGAYALLANLQAVSSRFTLEPQVSAFMAADAKETDTDAVGRRLKADPRVASVRFVPRDEALKSLQRTEGFADIIAALERNPLPDAYVVRLRDPTPGVLDALAAELRTAAGVAHVQTDSAWAQRLAALVNIGRIAILLLTAMLSAGLLAVTFNSIRLQILTQREEIEVSRLLGATDGFIQRPFYYLGALQGLAGGAIALGAVGVSFVLLNRGVRTLASSYGSTFELEFVGPADGLAIALFAGLLGWLGANMSVSMYLRDSDSR